jgi:serine/threonine protein kinase
MQILAFSGGLPPKNRSSGLKEAMKYCDTCHTTYPNEFSACPKDQAPLRETAEMVEGMVIREKYQIVRKIGEGRMATVYQAKHLTFNETRALKVLQNRLAQDEAFVNRFKSEAVTRKLQHENAVRVEDFDFAEDDSPFLVMEYVDGKSLRNVMVDGPVPPARAANIARQIALALAAAHKLGITHRDIKPENVLLVQRPDGGELVKVLEFGLAKVREQSTDLLPQYATTTKTAVVVGTPQYISPEQAMGKKGDDIDARADIYSLGITLYEMLVGKLPFESATPVGMLVQHITATPKAPKDVRSEVPAGLSDIVMKAIQKSRDNRYQAADEMASAIEKAQPAEAPRPAAIPTPPPKATFTPKPGTVMIKFETPKATKVTSTEVRPSASAAAVKTPPPLATPKLRTGTAAAAAPAVSSIAEPIFDRQHPSPQLKAPTFDAMNVTEKPGSKMPLIATAAVVGILVLGALIFWPKKSATSHNDAATQETSAKSDDSKVLLDVQQLLATSPTFNNVNATVSQGVVTLSGLVASKSDSERADGIVKNSIGVKDVKNEIAVDAKKLAKLEAAANAPPPKPIKAAPAAKARNTQTAAVAPTPAPVAAAPVNPGQLRARAMIALGNRQVDSGDYSGAVNAFQSALILDPGNAAAEAGLRRANEAMKNH